MTTVEERLSRLEGVYDHLSSKADVAKVETQISELRAELKGDIADLRGELKGDIANLERKVDGLETRIDGLRAEMNANTAGLRAEMYRVNAGLIKWGVGSMVVMLGAMAAMVRFLG